MNAVLVPTNTPHGFLKAQGGFIIVVTTAVFVLGALITAWIGYMLPRYWVSVCVIEPIPAANGILSATDPASASATMASKECLREVVRKTDLSNRWGMDEENAVMTLKETVSVRQDGNLITVSSRQRSPELARDLARAVPAVWAETTRNRSTTEYRTAIVRLEARAANRATEIGLIEREMKQPSANRAALEHELADMRKTQTALEEEARRLKVLDAGLTSPMVIHEEPRTTDTPVEPDVPALFGKYLPVSLLAGVVLGLALAAWRHRMTRDTVSPVQAQPAPETGW